MSVTTRSRMLLLAGVLGLAACSPTTTKEEPAAPSAASAPASAPPAKAWFRDITDEAKISFLHDRGATPRKYLPETMGAGACPLDADLDGDLDLYFVQSGPVPGAPGSEKGGDSRNVLLRNDGGTYVDVSAGSGADDPGYGQGCVPGDVDGDGDEDLYVVNFGANVLLRNDGGMKFTDVTAAAGVGDRRWGSSAAFFDADGDGDLDLYVTNYVNMTVATHVECGDTAAGKPAYCHPDAYEMAPDVFYRNRGDGTFEDATREAGFTDTTGKGLGVMVLDADDDGDQDVYVANDSTPNFEFVNQGDGTFVDDAMLLGTSHDEDGLTQASMGVAVGDVDGDGGLDILVTSLSRESNALYLRGAGGYRYASRSRGVHVPSYGNVGWGTDLPDLDLDGDLDMIVTNGHVIDNIALFEEGALWRQPGQILLNDGTGHYAELPASECGAACAPRNGRGLVRIDHDSDGRLDFIITENGGPARLVRNEVATTGGWIGFRLAGRAPNTGAVGARVTIVAGGRTQLRERQAGGSYQCSHDPRLHFGLGSATSIERAEIRWPDGSIQQLGPLEIGRYHLVEQAAASSP